MKKYFANSISKASKNSHPLPPQFTLPAPRVRSPSSKKIDKRSH
ncbi:hypothetical protein [Nostoc sp. DSM 114160]